MCGACEVARVYDCIVWCINFFISVQSVVLQDAHGGLSTARMHRVICCLWRRIVFFPTNMRIVVNAVHRLSRRRCVESMWPSM